ncbi:unnamed protein product [Durusdinium trenchii]|uniref:Uncharacterized protein n=1 Tax=Durusdinium trenchii TaxID=1381693 RepID=A0ABP0KIC1_9DINO
MGGTQAREEELQDDVFPWFHLIQWSAEDASNNRIFHYDLAGAQEAARALTRDTDSFLRLCPSSLPPNSGFTMDDSTNFAEWAGALLEWNSELRRVRFELVPRRRWPFPYFVSQLRGPTSTKWNPGKTWKTRRRETEAP